MITLAISSLKGGVGKTTCAINLAFTFARRGWKTLLVDTDPQGSVGLSLTPEAQTRAGFYELISSNLPLPEVMTKTKLETLGIIMAGQVPSNDLSRWCASLQEGLLLTPFFRQAAESGVDLMIIDTPSGLHGPTEGVLRNSSHVLVPQQCEPLALRALMQMIDFLGQLQSEGIHCNLAGVVLNMVDLSLEECRQIVAEVKQLLPPSLVCQALLPRDPQVLQASMKGVPLGMLRKETPPPIAAIFEQLAAELEPKLGLVPVEENNERVSLVV